MNIRKEFYSKLPSDKFKINWAENPIRMDMFLSFLTISVLRSKNHLGCRTGWTLHENKEEKLLVGGGVVGGVELLDSLQFGHRLSNPYNNYVNPFFLWEILNDKGRKFFFEYYEDDISEITNILTSKIKKTQDSLIVLKAAHKQIQAEIEFLKNDC